MGQGATWDISTFTVNFFIQNALWKKGDAPSQCLFYSPAYGLDLFTFFSHMSQALAEICTGNIYIMSISPLEIINRYSGTHPVSGNPSILTTIELGTLRNRYNTDPTSHDGVGSLIAIDATTIGATQPTMYQLNWDDSLSKVRQISRREVELEHSWVLDLVNATRGPAHKLSARNTCNANVAYENGDWFG
ncbi:hypothetical protein C8A05DRAFT_37969 [Staphylotrichum tortipilum]|uniref:Uncharacterized protein n=1 Tax=Staphylotrichum tortipilum TaxID=2831512 RepID=A0AAN6ME84_9PEZI|nr:hypothetical protein C8A05DRAFT_37969 [Staphylotrichum longicolle]